MSERLKEFYKKIHNPKNNIPIYATILVRSARKLIDFKIRKEPENILRVIAHDEKKTGWFIHSFHIPIKNLGLSPDSKDKEILAHLSDPSKVPNKTTREFVEDILRKYIDILPEKKRYYFKTERFKKKKEFQTGVKLKGF
ncbi:MAG: hypothetical protein ACFE8M_10780 [Candidatus Hermodarchaeota archaeon]